MRSPNGSTSSADPGLTDVDATQVEDVLRAFASALRSYRLYEGHGPILDRFVETLRQKLSSLFDDLPELQLAIEEDRLRWTGEVVLNSAETGSDLPFLLYKDGVRELTLLPGFEEDELVRALAVLAKGPSLHQEEDDLITLLWQEDFASLRYSAVEVGVDSLDLPGPEGTEPTGVDPGRVRAAAAEPGGITTKDFQEALHFLDPAELRRLRDEVQRENERDLWSDVLTALLDRLEDGSPERQVRIVRILEELLPSALATGEFGRAASMLQELVDLASRGNVLSTDAMRELRRLFDELGSDTTVAQLTEILEEMPGKLSDPAVMRLLSFFPPQSIGPMMAAADRVQRPEVKRAFEGCVQRLAESNREAVLALLESGEPAIIVGALRWVGRLELGSAVDRAVRFFGHGEPQVRAAAVEAVVVLRSAAHAKSMIPLLDDPERQVRMVTARGLGTLGYVPAREALERALSGKRLRSADRNEKLVYFEAFGRLAGSDGVPFLDRILNSRTWLGRPEPADLRASAALALGRIRHPSARDSLSAAIDDPDPVVRSMVARALRGEEGS